MQFCWGPLCFCVTYMIVVNHPLRHPLQSLVGIGQIYGDILYYATGMFDHYYKNVTYCRPEPYYFWFYFFFMNFIWIVIPGGKKASNSPDVPANRRPALLVQSFRATSEAFSTLEKLSDSSQENGGGRSSVSNRHLKSQ